MTTTELAIRRGQHNCHENRRKAEIAEIGDNESAPDLGDLAAWDAALKESAGIVKVDRGDVRVQVLCTLTELEHAAACDASWRDLASLIGCTDRTSAHLARDRGRKR